ncbi:hypothetical protein, partial [Asaia spathodeae]
KKKSPSELTQSLIKSIFYTLVFITAGYIAGKYYTQFAITPETVKSLTELFGNPNSKITEIEFGCGVTFLVAAVTSFIAARIKLNFDLGSLFWEELPSMWRTLSGSYLSLSVAFLIVCHKAALLTTDIEEKKNLIKEGHLLLLYFFASIALVFVPTIYARITASWFDRKQASPNAAQPNAAQPNAAQPDTAQPDTAQPDTAQPDTAQPDTAQPDTAQPDTAQPDTAQPDTAKLDAALKDDLNKKLHNTPS